MDEEDIRLRDVSKHNDCPGLIRKIFISGLNGYEERKEFEETIKACGGIVQDFIIDYNTEVIEYFLTTYNFYKFLEKIFKTKYSDTITFKKVVLKYGKRSKAR